MKELKILKHLIEDEDSEIIDEPATLAETKDEKELQELFLLRKVMDSIKMLVLIFNLLNVFYTWKMKGFGLF